MLQWIKNCGLKHPAEVETAVATGATHIGLMHYAPSPRHLSLEAGETLRASIPSHIKTVAVLVKPDDATLQEVITRWQPDCVQIHGVMDEKQLSSIKSRFDIALWLAVAVKRAEDIAQAEWVAKQAQAEALLLDAAKEGMHGGTGESFDWDLLKTHAPTMPWLLAGGLSPENVAEAIARTQPHGVDVSSGIEEEKGKKSLEKIAAFNQAVLTTRT